MNVYAPLIIAATGIPALCVAVWSGRPGTAHARGVGLRWALIALSLFVGGIGVYLAGDNHNIAYGVVIALVVAVNALGVSLLMHLRRGNNGTPRGE
ncbi:MULTISPECIES: hypothetical protein [unclassified Stenotrophomonas]|uniref:hypothetical protein n=1 Tax=unclassified Stenotrophomonas TaxID=196198 RepID=UPI0025F0D44F|nr:MULTISPECIES: hypothetical protein [unclassified Stenotrophomonas]